MGFFGTLISAHVLALSLVSGAWCPRAEAGSGRDRQRILDAATVLERTQEGRFLLEAARAFYASPDYAPVLKLRLASAHSDVLLAEGYTP